MRRAAIVALIVVLAGQAAAIGWLAAQRNAQKIDVKTLDGVIGSLEGELQSLSQELDEARSCMQDVLSAYNDHLHGLSDDEETDLPSEEVMSLSC